MKAANDITIEELQLEAVKQVTLRGYSVADVAERMGTTTQVYAMVEALR